MLDMPIMSVAPATLIYTVANMARRMAMSMRLIAALSRCVADCQMLSPAVNKRAPRSGDEAASSMPRAMTLQLGAALLKDQSLPV